MKGVKPSMFKVNNRNTRTKSGVFIVNFEHISHLALMVLLLTLNMGKLNVKTHTNR